MKLVIGSDHRGFAHKEYIKKNMSLAHMQISWIDVGAFDITRSDYPVFAKAACQALVQEEADGGILLCGTGLGMAVVANRHAHIYAGVTWSPEIARLGKEDDNINMVVIPADFVTQEDAIACVKAWLQATFRGGRYQDRIAMIDE